jgi:hypothetical protein
VALLREAGVGVEVLQDGAVEAQNEQYLHRMRTGRPFTSSSRPRWTAGSPPPAATAGG